MESAPVRSSPPSDSFFFDGQAIIIVNALNWKLRTELFVILFLIGKFLKSWIDRINQNNNTILLGVLWCYHYYYHQNQTTSPEIGTVAVLRSRSRSRAAKQSLSTSVCWFTLMSETMRVMMPRVGNIESSKDGRCRCYSRQRRRHRYQWVCQHGRKRTTNGNDMNGREKGEMMARYLQKRQKGS